MEGLRYLLPSPSSIPPPTTPTTLHRGSPVRTIVSSPALDVVGVGLSDGRAILLNVRYNEVLASFKNASGAKAFVSGLFILILHLLLFA